VTERTTIRLHPPVILWWVWVAFVLLNVVDYALQGLPSARFGAVLASLLLLVTALVYTLALRPRVIEDGEALTVVNPFRVHCLPWPRIQSVETGEWVRVRYTRGGPDGSSEADGAGRTGGTDGTGGASGVVNCWALYVSTRARRKVAVGAPPPRADAMSRRLRGLAAQPAGYAQPSSKLPDEARYLASLPVSAAIAVRLNTRAEKARTRAAANASAAPSAAHGATVADEAGVATTTWSWPALATVAVPALILLAVALA
jgi:Bacterial PH domain